MYVINGINSDIAQSILKKILKKNKILGFYRNKYKGLKDPNLKVLKFNSKNKNKIKLYFKKNKNLIFINFAAIRDEQLFINSSIKHLKSIIDNNIFSSLEILKILIPEMINHRFGRIIFISSSTSEKGSVGNLGYSTSKSSLLGLSNTLAKEYSLFNITSNIISLGYFESKMWFSLKNKVKKKLLEETLIKKLGNTDVIYNTIKLISKNRFINMSKINLDGGNLKK